MKTKAASLSSKSTQEFVKEADLVEQFVDVLQRGLTCYGKGLVTTEWDHRAGVVDVLFRDAAGALVAFEAKLANWRRASLQAYRNTAYANRAYVLLPPKSAERAAQDRSEFELRGIGLCSFDGVRVQILVEAADQAEALLGWIRTRAHQHFDTLADDGGGSKRRRPARSGTGTMFPAGSSVRP